MGAINGVNKDFTLAIPYKAGTLRVWINGVLVRDDDDDGWVETSSIAFQLKEAPLTDDRVQVYRVEQ